jgi:K+-transporting ATPase A subunit
VECSVNPVFHSAGVMDGEERRFGVSNSALAPNASNLAFAALASVIAAGLSSLANNGPHGLTVILSALAIAGSMVGKKGPGALSFFPSLSLDALMEHFLMQAGRTF